MRKNNTVKSGRGATAKSNSKDESLKTSSSILAAGPTLIVRPQLAERIGLNKAIILQQIEYWTSRESARIQDGRRWCYCTHDEWQEQFPFWSVRTIKNAIYSLKENGLIISKQLDQKRFNATNFYTIDYEKLDKLFELPSGKSCPMDEAKTARPSGKSCPIMMRQILPDHDHEINEINKKEKRGATFEGSVQAEAGAPANSAPSSPALSKISKPAETSLQIPTGDRSAVTRKPEEGFQAASDVKHQSLEKIQILIEKLTGKARQKNNLALFEAQASRIYDHAGAGAIEQMKQWVNENLAKKFKLCFIAEDFIDWSDSSAAARARCQAGSQVGASRPQSPKPEDSTMVRADRNPTEESEEMSRELSEREKQKYRKWLDEIGDDGQQEIRDQVRREVLATTPAAANWAEADFIGCYDAGLKREFEKTLKPHSLALVPPQRRDFRARSPAVDSAYAGGRIADEARNPGGAAAKHERL